MTRCIITLGVLVLAGLAWIFSPYLEYLRERPAQSDFNAFERMGLFRSSDGVDLLVSIDAQEGLRVFDVQSAFPGKTIPLTWRLSPAGGKRFDVNDDDGAVVGSMDFPDNDTIKILPASGGSEMLFRRAENPPYRQRLMEFENAGVEIAATVFVPNTADLATGIIMIHGSGESHRNYVWYVAQADYLARQGFTVLLPDKRGSGRSGGLWKMANMKDLAGDAGAGVNALLEMDEVSINRVGVMGLSQGGHIAPFAASENEKIAFVVNVAGSLTTFDENLRHESLNLFRGHTPEPLIAPLIFIASQVARARRPLWWFRNGSFDAAPYWIDLNVPGLIVWGAGDEYDNVPVSQSAAILEDINQRRHERGVAPIELKVYPDMGHALIDEDGWISEDYLSYLAEWIEVNGRDAPG